MHIVLRKQWTPGREDVCKETSHVWNISFDMNGVNLKDVFFQGKFSIEKDRSHKKAVCIAYFFV